MEREIELKATEVKGCPHCHAKPIMIERVYENRVSFEVRCPDHANFPVSAPGSTEDQAVAEWNENYGWKVGGADSVTVDSRPTYSCAPAS